MQKVELDNYRIISKEKIDPNKPKIIGYFIEEKHQDAEGVDKWDTLCSFTSSNTGYAIDSKQGEAKLLFIIGALCRRILKDG